MASCRCGPPATRCTFNWRETVTVGFVPLRARLLQRSGLPFSLSSGLSKLLRILAHSEKLLLGLNMILLLLSETAESTPNRSQRSGTILEGAGASPQEEGSEEAD